MKEKYIDQRKKRKKWSEGGKGEKETERKKERTKNEKVKESSAKKISSLYSQKIALETDKILS